MWSNLWWMDNTIFRINCKYCAWGIFFSVCWCRWFLFSSSTLLLLLRFQLTVCIWILKQLSFYIFSYSSAPSFPPRLHIPFLGGARQIICDTVPEHVLEGSGLYHQGQHPIRWSRPPIKLPLPPPQPPPPSLPHYRADLSPYQRLKFPNSNCWIN